MGLIKRSNDKGTNKDILGACKYSLNENCQRKTDVEVPLISRALTFPYVIAKSLEFQTKKNGFSNYYLC